MRIFPRCVDSRRVWNRSGFNFLQSPPGKFREENSTCREEHANGEAFSFQQLNSSIIFEEI